MPKTLDLSGNFCLNFDYHSVNRKCLLTFSTLEGQRLTNCRHWYVGVLIVLWILYGVSEFYIVITRQYKELIKHLEPF